MRDEGVLDRLSGSISVKSMSLNDLCRRIIEDNKKVMVITPYTKDKKGDSLLSSDTINESVVELIDGDKAIFPAIDKPRGKNFTESSWTLESNLVLKPGVRVYANSSFRHSSRTFLNPGEFGTVVGIGSDYLTLVVDPSTINNSSTRKVTVKRVEERRE